MPFLRYVEAKLTEKTHALMYRFYVSDALYASCKHQYMKSRYFDIYNRMKEPQSVNTQTSEEIIESIKSKLNALGD